MADLTKRWDKDTLDLKPDVLSILIGVNDLGHGMSAEEYEKNYDRLLDTTLKAMPKVNWCCASHLACPWVRRKTRGINTKRSF